ncbi:MAG: VanZ family protein [Lachnospiraceae bacterium]|nr:VanZ family protein [Lachnospiraceae bacterium]
MKVKEKRSWRRIGGILLVLYLVLLVYFLLFSKSFGRNPGFSAYRYNLIPFREIHRFYTYWKKVGFISAFLNLVGNLAGFIPLGILVPAVCRPMRRWTRTVKLGFVLTVILEVLQLVMKAGIFDVDDILLNTAGTLVGYLIFRIFSRFGR